MLALMKMEAKICVEIRWKREVEQGPSVPEARRRLSDAISPARCDIRPKFGHILGETVLGCEAAEGIHIRIHNTRTPQINKQDSLLNSARC